MSRLDLDFDLIFECFGKLHIALFIWLLMQLSTLIIVFIGFYSWINSRCNHEKYLSKNFKKKNFHQNNSFCLLRIV